MPTQTEKDIRRQALAVIVKGLLMFTIGIFLFSPCQQLIMRLAGGRDSEQWYDVSRDIQVYQDMIQKVNILALFTAVLCYVYYILRLFTDRKEQRPPLGQRLRRVVPLLLFWLFAAMIPAVTAIRGPNEYDLTGHPYMFESIYSYMLYPTCYFFCGAMLWKSRDKRILLYLLLFSALPLNIIALYSEWVKHVDIFIGRGVSAVFHNSNHYGYYLAIDIIASAILFVYEEKLIWKVIDAVSAVTGTLVLIPNNTLGAYLAVLIVLAAFAVYCLLKDRKHFLPALSALIAFLLVTFILSFKYNTIFSSFVQLSKDVKSIASDPTKADGAGSSRWRLWKGTVKALPESPWLGFGVEGLLNTHGVGTPHNELLQYAEFFGIPAMLVYFAAVVTVLVTVLYNSRKFSPMTMVCFCVAVGYFASSFFGVAIYYTTPFFYIFLGLAYAEHLHGVPASPETPAPAQTGDDTHETAIPDSAETVPQPETVSE